MQLMYSGLLSLFLARNITSVRFFSALRTLLAFAYRFNTARFERMLRLSKLKRIRRVTERSRKHFGFREKLRNFAE